MSRSLCLDSLSDNELLGRLTALIDQHRRVEADVVAHIGEVDARKLYLARACSSMHAYACEVLHLSEHAAYLRIACARASRRFPVVLDMLADGRLHLSAIAKLAPHLTEENAEALLGRAVHRTKRQIEELCAEVAPQPDAPSRMRKLPRARSGRDPLGPGLVPGATSGSAASSSSPAPPSVDTCSAARPAPSPAHPAKVEPIAPARFKVAFTASAELRDKLCRAQALLRHKEHGGDLADVVDEAVTLLLGKLEAKRFGKTKAPRKTLADTDTSASSRHVPAAVKRAVHERDGAQCTFVDEATGRRCSCTDPGQLEFHHVDPFARNPHHDPAKLTLRCRAHNAYQAELDFGSEAMDRYRKSPSRAREPNAAYGPRLRPPATEQRREHARQALAPTGEPQTASTRRSRGGKLRAPPTIEALRSSGRQTCALHGPGCSRALSLPLRSSLRRAPRFAV
jgi:hypothetical protein